MDPRTWPALRELFRRTFLERDRKEWEAVFDGTDACVTPVKTHAELRSEGFRMMPPVTLVESPAKESDGWEGCKLKAGGGGKEALEEWWGMKEGKVWVEEEEGVRLVEREEKAKL